MTTRAGWVSLDGFVPVLGQWDPNRRWNGWLCPSIDAVSVVTVLDAINRDNGDPLYMYDWTDEGYLMLIELQDEDNGVESLSRMTTASMPSATWGGSGPKSGEWSAPSMP